MDTTPQLQQKNLSLREKLKQLFPQTPYEIQLDFSCHLYETLSHKQFGIFSSPTGTGKSLSMICGGFAWLRDNQSNYDFVKMCKTRREEAIVQSSSVTIDGEKQGSADQWDSSLPDWLNDITDFNKSIFEQKLVHKSKQRADKAQRLNDYLCSRKEKLKIRYEEHQKQQRAFHQKKNEGGNGINQKNNDSNGDDDDQRDLCIEYTEENTSETQLKEDIDTYKRTKLVSTAAAAQNDEQQQQSDEAASDYPPVKIIYASRTHSQIKQFVQEIIKTEFKNMRVITLGSRANLCTNPCIDVSKISSQSIDDYCQKAIGVNKTDKSVKPCNHYHNLKMLEQDVSYLFHAQIHTLDDMKASAGLSHHVCPYFLAKQSVSDADVICVPYVSLLDAQMREANGIDVRNAVILFDESHNILESMRDAHSAVLSMSEIFTGYLQLQGYYDKYCRMLHPKNALHIQTIKNLCLDLLKFITKKQSSNNLQNQQQQQSCEYSKIDAVALLLFLNMDRIDFYALRKFVAVSKVSQKVHFFSQSKHFVSNTIPPSLSKIFKDNPEMLSDIVEKKQKNAGTQQQLKMTVECVIQFLWRLQTSTTALNQSRYSLILKRSQIDGTSFSGQTIEILCLDVMQPLQELVNESACVILAGGTMEPISEFQPLMSAVGTQNTTLFSCQHVIDKMNCQALCVSSFMDTKLVFSYQNKQDDKLISLSLQLIIKLAKIVPSGLVVFVQSYTFLERLRAALIQRPDYLTEISQTKKVFFDEKEAGNASRILENYQKEIDKGEHAGALLISVVGGRLSEGINFSDRLARCVVVLGMPYSNIKSADMVEKMAHYDRLARKPMNSQKSTQQQHNFTGNDYYETICMKAVNQAVGRSIRHRNDYAIILLVDDRFAQEKNLNRLSGWLRDRTKSVGTFEVAEQEIVGFFATIGGRVSKDQKQNTIVC